MGFFDGNWFTGGWYGGQWFGIGEPSEPPPVGTWHTFDTGLPKPQRTLIREALVRRLAPLLKAAGGYLHGIAELPRPLRSIAPETEDNTILFRVLNGRAPAVAIALGKRTHESSGTLATEGRGTIEVFLYVASQHNRGLVDGRLAADVVSFGSASSVPVVAPNKLADPGIEVMLEHVEQMLLGHSLEDEDGDELATIGELRETDEDELDTFEDVTVWQQRYEIAVDRIINPARDVTQLLLSIQGNHTESAMLAVTPGTHELAPLITIATLSPEEP